MTVTIRNPFVGHGHEQAPKRPPAPSHYRYTLTPIDDMFTAAPDERAPEQGDRRTGLLAVSFAIVVVLAATIGVAILLLQLIHGVFVYFA
jgi:hypothetical protein